jgi:hypothetical protein
MYYVYLDTDSGAKVEVLHIMFPFPKHISLALENLVYQFSSERDL